MWMRTASCSAGRSPTAPATAPTACISITCTSADRRSTSPDAASLVARASAGARDPFQQPVDAGRGFGLVERGRMADAGDGDELHTGVAHRHLLRRLLREDVGQR